MPRHTKFKCILQGMGDDGSDYEYDDYLGTWLSNQRQMKSSGKLAEEHESELQALVDEGKYHSFLLISSSRSLCH